MSETFKLYRLQQVDSQLDNVQRELQSIAERLADRSTIEAAERKHQASANKFDQARRALQKAEAASEQQRIKIQQTEAMLYSGKVRNPKELQDLQNEVAALKRHLVLLEDHQLEAIETFEDAEQRLKKSGQLVVQKQNNYAELARELKQSQSSLTEKASTLEVERRAAASSVNAEYIVLYNDLRQKKHGIAVSALTEGACSACGATLTSKRQQAVHASQTLARCDSCGRILYG